MKPEQDDRLLEETIRRAVGSEAVRFDATGWMRKYREEVLILRSRKSHTATGGSPKWRIWRTIMGTRSTKTAALAAVVGGIAIAVILWPTAGGSTVALAAVLEQLQTKSYEFQADVRTPDGASTSVKGMVLEPGKLRLEQVGGLGTITSIIDSQKKEAVVLLSRSKVAYRFDKQERPDNQEKKEPLGMDFLILPGRSIEDLWKLKPGAETKLGQKEIGAQPADGFRVKQRTDECTETITVWADAKTAFPVTVEVTLQSNKDGKQILELTLRDFKVVAKPSPALFSTDVPEGYTLANQQTLQQLTTTPATGTTTPEGASAEARKILAALELWNSGDKPKAIEALVAVDWKGEIRFGREQYLFTMTESQYVSLVTADQTKVSREGGLKQLDQCRAMGRELVDLGKKARAAKEVDKAEKYFSTAAGLGQLLDRNSDLRLIVRLVGIAIQKSPLTELSGLYEERGQPEKLKAVREKLSQLEEEQSKIKKNVQGQ